MSNIEKIRQEIERRKEELERDKYINIDAKACRHSELKFLERFIDSLPEEKPSEDLEEAAGLYLDNHKPLTRYNWGDLQDAFIAGAEWQEKQLEKPFEESKGMPRQKTAYINGHGVETR